MGVPRCSEHCADSESFSRTKAKWACAIYGVANMQRELMTNGPIQVAFTVYSSFYSYRSGVYSPRQDDRREGGHAVKMSGWGVSRGTEYWIADNSWGSHWGFHGSFWIVRGENECGIEEDGPPYAGLPELQEDVLV